METYPAAGVRYNSMDSLIYFKWNSAVKMNDSNSHEEKARHRHLILTKYNDHFAEVS